MKKNSEKYYVYGQFGEVDYISNKNLIDTIMTAWNYESRVYTLDTDDLIFDSYLDNDELNELLEPYDLRVIDGEKFRELQIISTGEIRKVI